MRAGSALADLLRTHRRRAMLTQETLARRAGLSVRTISDLERGIQTSPRSQTVRQLADALGLGPIEAERLLAAATRRPLAEAEAPEGAPPSDDQHAVAEARAASQARAWPLAMQRYADSVASLEARADPIDELLCDSLLGYGDAATMGVQRHLARRAYLRAGGIALRSSDRERLLRAGAGYAFMTKAGEPDPAAEELWHRALVVTAEDDLVARAILGSARAVAIFLDGFVERAQALASHSLVLARQIEDPTALAVSLAVTCITGWGMPNPEERLALACELAGVSPTLVPANGMEGLELQGVPLLELGRFTEFGCIVERFVQAGDADGAPSVRAQAAQWNATRALLDDKLDDAERLAAEATELAGHPPNFTMGHAAQVFSARKLADRDGELVEALRDFAQLHAGEPAWRVTLALTLARAGDTDEAAAALRRARFELWPLPAGWTKPVNLAFLIEACALVGDAELATMCEAELEAYRGLFVVPSTGTSCEGSVERFLGLAALARDDRRQAGERLTRALDLERATGSVSLPLATERLLSSL